MARRILKLVNAADPTGSRLFEKDQPGPYFKRNSSTDLLCGRCAEVLAESIDPEEFKSVRFRCPACKSLNDTGSYFVPHGGG